MKYKTFWIMVWTVSLCRGFWQKDGFITRPLTTGTRYPLTPIGRFEILHLCARTGQIVKGSYNWRLNHKDKLDDSKTRNVFVFVLPS
ncbi:hypothetical protein METBIDRAFT_150959 [Metschnikowia bicuspidata var. bicuspidata NRRL YB-4993]|uniref:Secreted protein n=1 Tax=Metschnikowia bicuspidata var. bicuspidata NRRL YB-4993 TaxID=869754 RepID=A0A1A0HEA9_9ASCO|nr:hypothetical protein METBIDRAFT_150959 [Metschnikowia bicuspidata var. bicuspidata NRRL YB-4993]OBA22325.1 hypothetical protein METBIDRAFT_150959 [Metschnikowia bicuspidata var. bicuspidata NRRL YB-4993]